MGLHACFEVVATGIECEALSNDGHFLLHLTWRLVREMDELRRVSRALHMHSAFKSISR